MTNTKIMYENKKHSVLPIELIHADGQCTGHRIDVLDVLKAVAIFFVIFTHIPLTCRGERSFIFPLLIDQAVPVFIILMGYCHMLSQTHRADGELKCIGQRILSFIIPWVLTVLIEIAIIVAVGMIRHGVSLQSLLRLSRETGRNLLFYGGFGPGGFFVPVLLQLCFIVPFLARIRGQKLLASAFLFNLAFEFFVRIFAVSTLVYRILAFRYVFLAASGIYLFDCRKNRTPFHVWQLLSIGVFGAAYLLYLQHFHRVPAVKNYWMSTNMLTAFYLFPILYLILQKFEKTVHWNLNSMSGKIMRFAGRRSYHVYLAQMLYFFIACGCFAALAKRLPPSHKLLTSGGIDMLIGVLSFPLSLILGFCLFHLGGIAEKILLGGKGLGENK